MCQLLIVGININYQLVVTQIKVPIILEHVSVEVCYNDGNFIYFDGKVGTSGIGQQKNVTIAIIATIHQFMQLTICLIRAVDIPVRV